MIRLILVFLLFVSNTFGTETNENKRCLDDAQYDRVIHALKQLQDIDKSIAEIKFSDSINFIRDLDNRVYLNGGKLNPVRAKLAIGKYVSRDLEFELPARIYDIPAPPEPMFRLRVRAQTGILIPQAIEAISGPQNFMDIWIGLDFFNYKGFNISLNPGIYSISSGIGYDITKNFGFTAGYALTYKIESSLFSGIYFSFN